MYCFALARRAKNMACAKNDCWLDLFWVWSGNRYPGVNRNTNYRGYVIIPLAAPLPEKSPFPLLTLLLVELNAGSSYSVSGYSVNSSSLKNRVSDVQSLELKFSLTEPNSSLSSIKISISKK